MCVWGKILFRFLIRKPGRSSKKPFTMPIHAGLVPRAATDLIRSSLLSQLQDVSQGGQREFDLRWRYLWLNGSDWLAVSRCLKAWHHMISPNFRCIFLALKTLSPCRKMWVSSTANPFVKQTGSSICATVKTQFMWWGHGIASQGPLSLHTVPAPFSPTRQNCC